MLEISYGDKFIFREYDDYIVCDVVATRKILKKFSVTRTQQVKKLQRRLRYTPAQRWFCVKKQDEVSSKSNRALNNALNKWKEALRT